MFGRILLYGSFGTRNCFSDSKSCQPEYVRDKVQGSDSRKFGRELQMSSEEIPTMQLLYNRIFLLAVASLVFFFLVYVGWGLIDILSVPVR